MTTKVQRRGVWVGLAKDQREPVEVLRVSRTAVRARFTGPGEWNGVVCDLHPADVVIGVQG